MIWVILVVFQVGFLWYLGDGLNRFADHHAEADTLRAAQAYVADGLWTHHGLARILYGPLFPNEGTIKDHIDSQGQVVPRFRQGFPEGLEDRNQWPLTHYPPAPDLINGIQSRILGPGPIWRLRLFPVAFGFAALAYFFRTVSLVFGTERGSLISLALAVLPMVSLWLSNLHYEGYALALVLVQTGLLLRILWRTGRAGVRTLALLFLIGFAQGWLSWDHFFLVSLLAVPWWLLRRAEGAQPSLSLLFWITAAAMAGYALAHILHFWEVAAELGGWRAAWLELFRTGLERAGVSGGGGWRAQTVWSLHQYFSWCFNPRRLTFGPFFGILFLLSLTVSTVSIATLQLFPRKGHQRLTIELKWPGAKNPFLPMAVALALGLMWLFVMPSFTAGNSHLGIRHMLTFYLCMAVVFARSFQIRREIAEPPIVTPKQL